MKKEAPKSRTRRSRNVSLQLNTVLKRLEEILSRQEKHHGEMEAIKREMEDLRRDISITMESLAELPFVSGMIH